MCISYAEIFQIVQRNNDNLLLKNISETQNLLARKSNVFLQKGFLVYYANKNSLAVPGFCQTAVVRGEDDDCVVDHVGFPQRFGDLAYRVVQTGDHGCEDSSRPVLDVAELLQAKTSRGGYESVGQCTNKIR